LEGREVPGGDPLISGGGSRGEVSDVLVDEVEGRTPAGL
jgi:hypothetical protein